MKAKTIIHLLGGERLRSPIPMIEMIELVDQQPGPGNFIWFPCLTSRGQKHTGFPVGTITRLEDA